MKPAQKSVAIVQSCYIPWKGYFDLIAASDEFILYDDVQYTKRDWRNRNQVKTPAGPLWLSVPVKTKGSYVQLIRDTQIEGADWSEKHFKTFRLNYARAPYCDEISDLLAPIYRAGRFNYLSDLNRTLLEAICVYLGIKTRISKSSDYPLMNGQSERLADLCAQAGGTEYISGPAAKNYLDETIFHARDLSVRWFDYAHYPEYPQLWGDFIHTVSIVDLLYNCGPNAPDYMKYAKRSAEKFI